MHHKDKITVEGIGPVTVSTVLLPMGLYETCLFWKRDSEVVERYGAPGRALRGHSRWLDADRIAARIRESEREREANAE